mgnify:CR=1 FL=1
MDDVTLPADTGRPLGSAPSRRLRRQDLVPAVVYGGGGDSLPVTVPARELRRILAGESGANTLINLEIGGERHLVFARQIQRDPVRSTLLHVDFIRVRRDELVTAEVPIHALGEAVGVRDGGLLEQVLFFLTIESMPDRIPTGIEIDVTSLVLGAQIMVGELPLPEGVTTQVDLEALVVHVSAPRGLTAGGEGGEGEGETEAAGESGAQPRAAAGDEGGSDDA